MGESQFDMLWGSLVCRLGTTVVNTSVYMEWLFNTNITIDQATTLDCHSSIVHSMHEDQEASENQWFGSVVQGVCHSSFRSSDHPRGSERRNTSQTRNKAWKVKGKKKEEGERKRLASLFLTKTVFLTCSFSFFFFFPFSQARSFPPPAIKSMKLSQSTAGQGKELQQTKYTYTNLATETNTQNREKQNKNEPGILCWGPDHHVSFVKILDHLALAKEDNQW